MFALFENVMDQAIVIAKNDLELSLDRVIIYLKEKS